MCLIPQQIVYSGMLPEHVVKLKLYQFLKERVEESLLSPYPYLHLVFYSRIPEAVVLAIQEVEREDHFFAKLLNDHTSKKIRDLYNGFIRKFNRVPIIFRFLLEMIDELNVSRLIKTFEVKAMRYR